MGCGLLKVIEDLWIAGRECGFLDGFVDRN